MNPQRPCPDCRIELVGPCPEPGHALTRVCTAVLGHAYAVGQPVPIRHWVGFIDPPDGEWLACSATTVAKQVCHNGGLTTYPAITDRLAHYSQPESLVGKWALQVQVVS